MKAMGRLSEFEVMLQQHPYIFHVHTDFTDGTSSVEDYCKFARRKGFSYLIFTEHVRQVCDYDFEKFIHTVENARRQFAPLKILLGVESKVLPGGNLDISDEALEKIDLLGIACHSFPAQLELYAESMAQAFRKYNIEDVIRVWLHPGLFFKRTKMLDATIFSDLLRLAAQCGVYIEHNIKYELPLAEFQAQVPPQLKVVGIDAHSVKELEERALELMWIEQSFREELMRGKE